MNGADLYVKAVTGTRLMGEIPEDTKGRIRFVFLLLATAALFSGGIP